jgi:hypothetical protein
MAVQNETVPPSLIHRIARLAVALGLGLTLSLYAFHRVTDPEPAMQRAREEAAVLSARTILLSYIEPASELRIVDPVSPDRKIGKSYIYPTDSGWEISGHYRRNDNDRWRPFLMALYLDHTLASLSVKDDSNSFTPTALQDPRFTANR